MTSWSRRRAEAARSSTKQTRTYTPIGVKGLVFLLPSFERDFATINGFWWRRLTKLVGPTGCPLHRAALIQTGSSHG
jgi:hypothetical protein